MAFVLRSEIIENQQRITKKTLIASHYYPISFIIIEINKIRSNSFFSIFFKRNRDFWQKEGTQEEK